MHWGIRHCTRSRWALYHRPGPLGGRRHHRGGDDGAKNRGRPRQALAATYAYDATAMPMLTGTLITAAGFLPIGLAKILRGRVHPTPSSRSPRRRCHLLDRFVYFVPYLGVVLLKNKEPRGRRRRAWNLFDTPFCPALPRGGGWCVQHRWITIGLTILHPDARHRGHGPGAAVLPVPAARDPGRPVAARRRSFPNNRPKSGPGFQAVIAKDPGVQGATWVWVGVQRVFLPWTRCSRRATCRSSSCWPQDAGRPRAPPLPPCLR